MEINSYGNLDLLQDNSYKLGIVGSRLIIQSTKDNLDNLFLELKNYDFTVISGGMYGVDLYAHNLALVNNLKTVVILPQGINSYMKSFLFSQLKIKNNSNFLLLSRYPDNFSPRKYTFLERNKLVSEYSEVLLVAQASIKSGSMSTAYNSFKLKKRIFSIPVGLDQPQFQGTNFLIGQGASIYLSPSSILNSFNLKELNVDSTIKNLLQKSSRTLEELESLVPIDRGLLKKSLLKLILKGEIFFSQGLYYL